MSLDVYLKAVKPVSVYEGNITHNLGRMAEEAGIYKALWRPEEIGVVSASQLIPLLEKGVAKMKADPDRFKKLAPDNGWGTYDTLVRFVTSYLEACVREPDSLVVVSR